MILTAALAVVVGGTAWLALLGPREPVYHGKSLSAWLEQYSKNPLDHSILGDKKHEQAETAIRHIGTNAVPHLLRLLATQDSRFKLKWFSLLENYSPFQFSFEPAMMKHSRASVGFMVLGSDAKSAIPALLNALQREHPSQADVHIQVSYALAAIGKDSVAALRPLLTNANADVRDRAAQVLGGFRVDLGSEVVADLVKLLKDEVPQVRTDTALAFARLRSESALPAIADNLQDTNAAVRAMSAYALGFYGEKAKQALPALEKAAQDQHPAVRKNASDAIEKINLQTQPPFAGRPDR